MFWEKNDYQFVAWVYVNGDWVLIEAVKVLTRQTDLFGCEIVTFQFQGHTYRSRVVFRPE